MIDKSLTGYWSRGLGMVWKIAMSDFWILVDYCWAYFSNSESQCTSTHKYTSNDFLDFLVCTTHKYAKKIGKFWKV